MFPKEDRMQLFLYSILLSESSIFAFQDLVTKTCLEQHLIISIEVRRRKRAKNQGLECIIKSLLK